MEKSNIEEFLEIENRHLKLQKAKTLLDGNNIVTIDMMVKNFPELLPEIILYIFIKNKNSLNK